MLPSARYKIISFPTTRYQSFRVELRLQISLALLLNKTHIYQTSRRRMKNTFVRPTVTSCGRLLPPVIRNPFGILSIPHTQTQTHLFNATYTYSNSTLLQHFLWPVRLLAMSLPGTRLISNIPHRNSRDTYLFDR